MQTNCYELSNTQYFTGFLVEGLKQELLLTPKPGLVDVNNNGSHPDLDFQMMNQSIQFLSHYYNRCAITLEQGGSIHDLRALGSVTEKIMLRKFGTNTHRGAVFLGGLMLAAVHAAEDSNRLSVSQAVARLSGELFDRQLPIGTPGSLIRQRYRVGGIIGESINGLPAVFRIAIPALLKGYAMGFCKDYAYLFAMAELMSAVEDTTTLKRGGKRGLKRIQSDGLLLRSILLNGDNPVSFLLDCDSDYQQKNLTMGGVADLLGVAIAWYLANETTLS